jgi:hypothetical protein
VTDHFPHNFVVTDEIFLSRFIVGPGDLVGDDRPMVEVAISAHDPSGAAPLGEPFERLPLNATAAIQLGRALITVAGFDLGTNELDPADRAVVELALKAHSEELGAHLDDINSTIASLLANLSESTDRAVRVLSQG